MRALLVLVAHNGKTLQLDVEPNTRVDAIQQALVAFAEVPIHDQIVMYQGTKLDPNKTLGAYRLPVESAQAVEDHPTFLYCRSYLKPGNPLPGPEALPGISIALPPPPSASGTHPLQSSPNLIARQLPALELSFQHHVLTARAVFEATQLRLQRCRQLLSEQEVQARCADAARANVEAHYTYICNAYASFQSRYSTLAATHAQLLGRFHADLAALQAIELGPQLQTERCKRLADLQPVSRLREVHESCRRSHEHFAAKVTELGAVFEALQADVESLFLQAPPVDLDVLGVELSSSEGKLDDQSSILQVLIKDLRTVGVLIEDIIQQGPTVALLDSATAVSAIQATHEHELLPHAMECDEQVEAFAVRCSLCKQRMTRDVLSQLQRISAQQSKIRDIKHKLAAFNEVLGRQDTAISELKTMYRLPSAYKLLLAECARRRAWHDMYAAQATKLAEHMARIRDKEASKRAAFTANSESLGGRLLPQDLLVRAGLVAEPPHCNVSLSAPPPALPEIGTADLQRLASLAAQWPLSASQLRPSASSMARRMGSDAADAAPRLDVADAPVTSMPGLEMENARLRAELAGHIAATCLRDLAADNPPPIASSSTVAASVSSTATAAAASSPSSTGGATGASPGRRPEPELVAALHKAMRMKEELIVKQQTEITALNSRLSSYEQRINQLERLMHSQSQHQALTQSGGLSPSAHIDVEPAPVPLPRLTPTAQLEADEPAATLPQSSPESQTPSQQVAGTTESTSAQHPSSQPHADAQLVDLVQASHAQPVGSATQQVAGMPPEEPPEQLVSDQPASREKSEVDMQPEMPRQQAPTESSTASKPHAATEAQATRPMHVFGLQDPATNSQNPDQSQAVTQQLDLTLYQPVHDASTNFHQQAEPVSRLSPESQPHSSQSLAETMPTAGSSVQKTQERSTTGAFVQLATSTIGSQHPVATLFAPAVMLPPRSFSAHNIAAAAMGSPVRSPTPASALTAQLQQQQQQSAAGTGSWQQQRPPQQPTATMAKSWSESSVGKPSAALGDTGAESSSSPRYYATGPGSQLQPSATPVHGASLELPANISAGGQNQIPQSRGVISAGMVSPTPFASNSVQRTLNVPTLSSLQAQQPTQLDVAESSPPGASFIPPANPSLPQLPSLPSQLTSSLDSALLKMELEASAIGAPLTTLVAGKSENIPIPRTASEQALAMGSSGADGGVLQHSMGSLPFATSMATSLANAMSLSSFASLHHRSSRTLAAAVAETQQISSGGGSAETRTLSAVAAHQGTSAVPASHATLPAPAGLSIAAPSFSKQVSPPPTIESSQAVHLASSLIAATVPPAHVMQSSSNIALSSRRSASSGVNRRMQPLSESHHDIFTMSGLFTAPEEQQAVSDVPASSSTAPPSEPTQSQLTALAADALTVPIIPTSSAQQQQATFHEAPHASPAMSGDSQDYEDAHSQPSEDAIDSPTGIPLPVDATHNALDATAVAQPSGNVSQHAYDAQVQVQEAPGQLQDLPEAVHVLGPSAHESLHDLISQPTTSELPLERESMNQSQELATTVQAAFEQTNQLQLSAAEGPSNAVNQAHSQHQDVLTSQADAAPAAVSVPETAMLPALNDAPHDAQHLHDASEAAANSGAGAPGVSDDDETGDDSQQATIPDIDDFMETDAAVMEATQPSGDSISSATAGFSALEHPAFLRIQHNDSSSDFLSVGAESGVAVGGSETTEAGDGILAGDGHDPESPNGRGRMSAAYGILSSSLHYFFGSQGSQRDQSGPFE